MNYRCIKLAGIYKIQIGDYYYVGNSVDCTNRWSNHYTLLKMNKHHSPKLQDKFNELGITRMSFNVLEYVSITEYKKVSQLKGKALTAAFNKLLLYREKYWMSQHSINFCLNKDDKHFV